MLNKYLGMPFILCYVKYVTSNVMLPNLFGMAALNCNRNLDFGDRLHWKDHPFENSPVLLLRLRLRPPTGNISGTEVSIDMRLSFDC